jgi:alkanesulfonate monooxygenase SsuD/methylene tetrahydromethanopterin reductase-like flavin-dependent oxidoreductase (luciferase family)
MSSMKISFGLEVPTFAGGGGVHRDSPLYEKIDWRRTREVVSEAESLGYDNLWMPDHLELGRDGEIFEVWTLLGAFAALTRRIKLGTLCIANTFRYPSLLAKMAATLDDISEGRVILGVGTGWNAVEHGAYGIPLPTPGERIERLREAITLMKKMWANSSGASFEGKYYRIENAICKPSSVQTGGPSVIVGAVQPRALKLAGELGDGWNLGDDPAPEIYRTKLEKVRSHFDRTERNWDSFQKTIDMHVVIGKNEKEYQEKLSLLKKHAVKDAIGSLQLVPGDILENCIRGTPESCITRIKQYASLGVTHFMLWFLDMPSSDGLKVFAKEVLPAFR